MLKFVGVRIAAEDEYVQYLIWRKVILQDLMADVLIVESKHVHHCLVFKPRQQGGDWMYIYYVQGSMFEDYINTMIEDSNHRTDLLERYDGADYFYQWSL